MIGRAATWENPPAPPPPPCAAESQFALGLTPTDFGGRAWAPGNVALRVGLVPALSYRLPAQHVDALCPSTCIVIRYQGTEDGSLGRREKTAMACSVGPMQPWVPLPVGSALCGVLAYGYSYIPTGRPLRKIHVRHRACVAGPASRAASSCAPRRLDTCTNNVCAPWRNHRADACQESNTHVSTHGVARYLSKNMKTAGLLTARASAAWWGPSSPLSDTRACHSRGAIFE